jgi:signal transduction histidine kinase
MRVQEFRVMSLEAMRRSRPMRWLFASLGLAVLALASYILYLKWRSPMLDFTLARYNSSDVYEVMPGGQAAAAGLHAGDVVVAVNGNPFSGWHNLQWDQTFLLGIEREGHKLSLAVAPVRTTRVTNGWLIFLVAAIPIFWGVSTLLLIRRFQQTPVRLLFLLCQIFTLLAAISNPYPWPIPVWLLVLSTACFHLLLFFFLHLHLVFPVPVGTQSQRRWLLAITLGLGLTLTVFYLFQADLGMKLSNSYSVLVIVTIILIIVHVYRRRATASDRRRLRLIIFSTIAGMMPILFGLVLPNILGSRPLVSAWQLGPFLIGIPLTYLYATARHNLFGIDRLLNRTLVYIILSSCILALYVGPVLMLYRLLPDDPVLEMAVIAGLTMLVGVGFNWARAQAQRWVDRLFYGGWYDYPDVVETISAALARTIEREQLVDALTRQTPALMQLRDGQLWIGEQNRPEALPPTSPTNLPTYQPDPLQLPLVFQGQVRGLWSVGARSDGDDLSAADHRILRTLAHQAEIALGNVLLVETLRRRLSEIREAQHQLLRSREDERARLARDLHDGPIQSLVGLNMQLGLLLTSSAQDTPLAEELGAMRSEMRGLLAELRQVCAELRPPMLDTLGLGASIRALAEEWSTQNNIATHLDLLPDVALRSLPSHVSVNLYRVVQEALTNVARHAQASQVVIRMCQQGDSSALTIQDDGRGFKVPPVLHELTDQGHFGLTGMQERVSVIGGKLTLESVPDQGTVVRVAWQ